MINDKLQIRGDVKIVKTNTETNKETIYDFRNLVVEAGIEFILFSMIDNAGDRPNPLVSMALGTNGAVTSGTDTALNSEIHRNLLTSKSVSIPSNSLEFQCNFVPGEATASIQEAGIFNLYTDATTTGGTMLCRTAFPAINKAAEDQITISWVITLALAP